VLTDDARRQAFSIDNGESFGSWPHNLFAQSWDVIIVPALREGSIDRLRALELDNRCIIMGDKYEGPPIIIVTYWTTYEILLNLTTRILYEAAFQ
jgi:hypothetical protein